MVQNCKCVYVIGVFVYKCVHVCKLVGCDGTTVGMKSVPKYNPFPMYMYSNQLPFSNTSQLLSFSPSYM